MIFFYDELPSRAVWKTAAIFGPVDLRSWEAGHLAVKCRGLSNPDVIVTHLDTEFWRLVTYATLVLCRCKIGRMKNQSSGVGGPLVVQNIYS